MMILAYLVCSLCGWSALAYLTWTHRGRWTLPRAALAAAFGFMAIGMTIWTLGLVVDLDAALGLNEVARLAAHLCVMAIVAAASVGLVHLAYPPDAPRVRGLRRLAGAAMAATLLVVIYTRTLQLRPPVQLNVEDARHLAVTGYLTVYLGTVAGYSADIAHLLWRFSGVTDRRWLRRGLRAAAAGAAVGMPYAASKAAFAISYWLGWDIPGEHVTTALLLTASSLLYATGLTMPLWGPAMDAGNQWRRRQRHYRHLYPLWRDLTAAFPYLQLAGGNQQRRLPLRGLGFALQRRVVEICDARLELRRYIDRRAAADARALGQQRRLDGITLEAAVEAARIAEGLAALRVGRVADEPDPADPHDPPGGYDEQLAWLALVSRAYRHPLTVTAARTPESAPRPTPDAVP